MDKIIFPKHESGLYLEHNPHKDNYLDALDYLHELDPDFVVGNAKARCVESDEIWTLQWYPRTPVGFNLVAAPTFEEVLYSALEIEKEE